MPITLKIWWKKLYHNPEMYIILEDIIINEIFYLPYLGLLYYDSCVSDIYQNIKKNIGHVWILRPHNMEKLIYLNYYSKC